jgi:acyl-CoA synthetase (AMP-forming)/AMP-acid ligase II
MWFEKQTLGQLVDRAAERWGHREALRFEGRRWTFAQLRAETDRVAKGLIAAGVQPGDHVCLWLGEICIRGYHVMQGYYRKPEETAKAIDADGWLHSGDLGFLREDGCLRFLGRYKDMLKVGGENVDPMEVEGFLLEDPRINHVAVVGVPDPRLAEVPVAFVIRERDAVLTEEDVLDLCRGRLASFKVPRRALFVDEFPMTGSGKIQKYLLRQEAERLCGAVHA